MALVEGNYVVIGRPGESPELSNPWAKKWHLVKYSSKNRGVVVLGGKGQIYFPKDYVGRRIRLKIEVFENEM